MLTLLFSIVQQITQEKHISYVFLEFSLPEYKCFRFTHITAAFEHLLTTTWGFFQKDG